MKDHYKEWGTYKDSVFPKSAENRELFASVVSLYVWQSREDKRRQEIKDKRKKALS